MQIEFFKFILVKEALLVEYSRCYIREALKAINRITEDNEEKMIRVFVDNFY